MAYCGPRGIPYDEWIGIAAGWTEHSRQCALAWQAREAGRCGGCGQPRDDWVDADGLERRPLPFEVRDVQCPSCDVLHAHRQDLPEQRQGPQWHQTFGPVGG